MKKKTGRKYTGVCPVNRHHCHEGDLWEESKDMWGLTGEKHLTCDCKCDTFKFNVPKYL
jgi:hypothetical protein